MSPAKQDALAGMMPPPVPMGQAPDQALYGTAAAGMMPSAPPQQFGAALDARSILRARQAQQGVEEDDALMRASEAARAGMNAEAATSDLLRIGRLIQALSKQSIVAPGRSA